VREHHFLSLEGGRCVFCDRELLPVQSIVDELIDGRPLYGSRPWWWRGGSNLLDSYDGIAAVTSRRGRRDCGRLTTLSSAGEVRVSRLPCVARSGFSSGAKWG